MAIQHIIGKYYLGFFGKRTRESYPPAVIYFFNDTDQYIGSVSFYKNEQDMPDNTLYETSDPQRVHVQMHVRELDVIVDMLRNEKPCRLWYVTPRYAGISTGLEPVGEEETGE